MYSDCVSELHVRNELQWNRVHKFIDGPLRPGALQDIPLLCLAMNAASNYKVVRYCHWNYPVLSYRYDCAARYRVASLWLVCAGGKKTTHVDCMGLPGMHWWQNESWSIIVQAMYPGSHFCSEGVCGDPARYLLSILWVSGKWLLPAALLGDTASSNL